MPASPPFCEKRINKIKRRFQTKSGWFIPFKFLALRGSGAGPMGGWFGRCLLNADSNRDFKKMVAAQLARNCFLLRRLEFGVGVGAGICIGDGGIRACICVVIVAGNSCVFTASYFPSANLIFMQRSASESLPLSLSPHWTSRPHHCRPPPRSPQKSSTPYAQ